MHRWTHRSRRRGGLRAAPWLCVAALATALFAFGWYVYPGFGPVPGFGAVGTIPPANNWSRPRYVWSTAQFRTLLMTGYGQTVLDHVYFVAPAVAACVTRRSVTRLVVDVAGCGWLASVIVRSQFDLYAIPAVLLAADAALCALSLIRARGDKRAPAQAARREASSLN